MRPTTNANVLEEQIAQWRQYLLRRQAIGSRDVAELEDHLREQVASLSDVGLAPDEAFLVAVKRMGNLDSLSREFALEHSERLWKQLVVVPTASADSAAPGRMDAIVAFALAVGAAIAIKAPNLFGKLWGQDEVFYARNISLFVLPFLVGYFVWKRDLSASSMTRWLAVAFVAAAIFANIYPYTSADSSTQILAAIHLPIALWLAVGIAYAGGRWSQVAGRMDFIRFSGEWVIYLVLIALGGGLLTGFLVMMFTTIGVNVERFVEHWLIPCGAAGAVIVAAWLVEAKQSVIENMAPVLTRLFSPLFTAVLLTFLGTLLFTGRAVNVEREMLMAFNGLLVIVLALMLYSLSARDPDAPPGIFDIIQVVLVVAALVADALALWNIVGRITEFGFSPNRVAVLGMNMILLVNLAWSAMLYVRFLRNRDSLAGLERWQTRYLHVYAIWAAIVVIVFPPLFGYR